MNKQACVYILASKRNGTLYTGVTSDLIRRVYQHKTKHHAESFTAKYDVDLLVWYCVGEDMNAAIALEKKIKNRSRAWKMALIEKENPEWRDLSTELMDSATPLHYAQNDKAGN
ncbi:GIY-YIG nuclease family protein [Teredinibacter turnerae]|uniref:GIY-YIG nuclease family protein n=1 Tax=Teredinibacter turnerae TaxID=2426 RepID=UPI0003736BE7|nr:GIY-YIG nuclease family protein [Teredinibacter turnerae]